ncbi:hypothetical protein D3C85_1377510 [compost metagenome]
MASAAAAVSATVGTGSAATGVGAATGAAAAATGSATGVAAWAAGAASRLMESWSPSTMKQHTASMSSGVQVLSIHTVRAPSARSLARTLPRLPISSSRDAASLSDTLVILTLSGKSPASAAGGTGSGAGAGAATTGAGAGAAATGAGAAGAATAAAGSLCSSANCLKTAQIRSNTASSGSSEAR